VFVVAVVLTVLLLLETLPSDHAEQHVILAAGLPRQRPARGQAPSLGAGLMSANHQFM